MPALSARNCGIKLTSAPESRQTVIGVVLLLILIKALIVGDL